MAIESGIQVDLSRVKETTRGVTPGSPTMLAQRATSRNINLTKDALESNEARSTRGQADVRHGFNRVLGTIGGELALADYDDLMEYCLGGSWAALGTGAKTLGVTAPSTFTRSGGSFLDDGFVPGHKIVTTGFTDSANNGNFRVVSVSAASMVVEETTLVTEVVDGS